MAICGVCETEMLESPSCVSLPVELIGGRFERVRYGSETRYGRTAARRGPCGDCGVHAGGTHHPGCDLEECPRCHGQLFSCGCIPDDENETNEDLQ
jgi:hypothetical protein